jgi:YHS domain-containing protein
MTQTTKPEINGHCPVAYLAIGEAAEGKAEFSSTHDGKLYYFVSVEAKQEFDSNPKKYVPAYGGRCAFGVSIEKDFEPDPANFKIINGRVHLFLKTADTDALELWNQDEEKCLASADRCWRKQSAE